MSPSILIVSYADSGASSLGTHQCTPGPPGESDGPIILGGPWAGPNVRRWVPRRGAPGFAHLMF